MSARRSGIVTFAMLLAACDAGTPPTQPTPPAPGREMPQLSMDAGIAASADAAVAPALERVDLDGDGVFDEIAVSFSGGAHCCYSLAITPSKSHSRVALPFELDGGYPKGFDLSQPRVFNIADYDGDGVVEICAQIQTYNGEENPLPRTWTQRYGIRTHWVEIRFATGALVVRDHGATTCERT